MMTARIARCFCMRRLYVALLPHATPPPVGDDQRRRLVRRLLPDDNAAEGEERWQRDDRPPDGVLDESAGANARPGIARRWRSERGSGIRAAGARPRELHRTR